MKNLIFLLSFIVVILLSAIFIGSTELRNLVRLKQSEVEGLKKENERKDKAFHKTLDSTRKAFKAQNDSIIFAHEKTIKANLVSQKEIKKLRGIIFIQHSDSSRTAELKTLYPSWQ